MMSSSYLILTIISLFSLSVLSAAEWLECGPPKSFEVELDNNKKIHVYDADVKVKYDRNELAVYDYPGLNAVNILINNTVVTFSGHVVPENEEVNHDAFKTSRVFNSKIAGSALLTKIGSNDLLTDCNLYLSRNPNEEELNIPKKLQVEILHEAATCVKTSICQKLGAVTLDDMRRGKKHPFDFGRLSVLAAIFGQEHSKSSSSSGNTKLKINANDIKALIAAYNKQDSNDVNRDGLQSTINKLVDIALAELVKKIMEENLGKINIPDVKQSFSTGSGWLETTGEFHAFDGTFEDLSTLKRTQDVSLSNTGMKFVASCGFGLTKANMEYQRYKLRFGIIKVNGKLSASVDGVALSAAVGVDYNQKPCRTVLQELRVSEIGKIKVKVTGLGPLNKLLSKLVTWITKKWQDDIVKVVEENLKDVILKYLNKFDCEKFRP